ncbi:hypothetical protein [Nakamurella sp.]|uniref:hypothetical protein n=1 Tax=Nakamurella sp. TaxID=1869182 RepID=UPI0037835153
MMWEKQDRRRRRLADLGIAIGACILAATGLTGCSAATPHPDAQEVADVVNTTTVTYHGQAPQDVAVPPGATGVLIDAIGGGGGAGIDDKGSLGAQVKTQAPLPVKSGDGLVVSIGGSGQNASTTTPGAGGWGGLDGTGGIGGPDVGVGAAAGAGGATTVQVSTGTGTGLRTLVVAGGGGGGASAVPDGVKTDQTGDDTGAPNLGGGDAGTNPEPNNSNPDFAIWQGSRGHGPAGGLAGVSSDPPHGGVGGQGASGGGSGGGGGGGFQGGYGGNGASSYGGDGSGGGAGSTAVSVQVSSGVIVAPAPDSFRNQNGQVTLTWLSS